jgi:hypothetical protein
MKRPEMMFMEMLVRNAQKVFRQAMGTVGDKKSRHRPHQGPQEKARRVRQLERGQISNYLGGGRL